MILTCPKCSSRFLVSAEALGDAGKKVRCTTCSEVWFQEPIPDDGTEGSVEDDVFAVDVEKAEGEGESTGDEAEEASPGQPLDEEADAETDSAFDKLLEEQGSIDDMDTDIPDAIMPNQGDGDLDFAETKDLSILRKVLNVCFGRVEFKAALGGYGLAILLFASLGLYVFAAQSDMIKSAPYTLGFYKIFGDTPDLPGQGLVFNDVVAEIDGPDLKIRGQVINLYKRNQTVPHVVGILKNEKGYEVFTKHIPLPSYKVKKGGMLDFKTKFKVEGLDGTESFTVRFDFKRPGESAKSMKVSSVSKTKKKSKPKEKHKNDAHH